MTPAAPTAEAFLDSCRVEAPVFELRPDYRALLLVVDGLSPEARTQQEDGAVDALLVRAEDRARALLAESPIEDLPHIAAWRDAYRAFGAKPQRTRNSLEALTRRCEAGLPRVNVLTDVYNAISVLHQIPLGGEDFRAYAGPARLVRATGDELFDATANGETVTEYPEPGEVVWRDDVGVTCRRWNWRQGRRTALTNDTRTAFFIFDALAPVDDEALRAAADELTAHLIRLSPDARAWSRLVRTPKTPMKAGA